MKLNHYNIIARIFPGIISSIPFFVLHFYYLRPVLGQFWGDLLGIQIASDVTISLALLFLLIQLSRYVSKETFEKNIFNGSSGLPTTDYLLHGDSHFSREYTLQIHQKIRTDFNLEIPSHESEAIDEAKSRKSISEAITHVRGRVGPGRLVEQHNAEYGFWRNLAGGAILALAMSLINIVVFSVVVVNQSALWISIILALIYCSLIVFAKRLIVSHGHEYAKVLIQEYMLMR